MIDKKIGFYNFNLFVIPAKAGIQFLVINDFITLISGLAQNLFEYNVSKDSQQAEMTIIFYNFTITAPIFGPVKCVSKSKSFIFLEAFND